MMFPGMDPRTMRQAMKRMGINQVDIEATEVVIRCPDKDIIISDPQVAKVNAMGQETFQISGRVTEAARTSPSVEIDFDDVKTVMDRTGASEDAARSALKEAEGDIAAAILALSGQDG